MIFTSIHVRHNRRIREKGLFKLGCANQALNVKCIKPLKYPDWDTTGKFGLEISGSEYEEKTQKDKLL